jgi:hypothetical protein
MQYNIWILEVFTLDLSIKQIDINTTEVHVNLDLLIFKLGTLHIILLMNCVSLLS